MIARGAVVLHEEVRRGREVCEGGACMRTARRCAIGVTDGFKGGVG